MDAALLFHHTHTPASNRFERAVRGLDIDSHATDYLRLARALPGGTDAVFVRTDHWRTDPAFFERLGDRMAAVGTGVDTFERHVVFEVDGTRAAVINGVEGSVIDDRYHITVCGLPLDDAATYRSLDGTELAAVCERAAWVAPAHVGLPGHRYPERLLASVFDIVSDSPARAVLGYPTGYPAAVNRISRNAVPGRSSVRALAARFDVPLLPELDLHATVPPRYAGCGVLPSSAVDDLADGHLPTPDILAADLLATESGVPGIPLRAFARTYDAFLPGLRPDRDWRKRFEQSLPDPDTVRNLDRVTDVVGLP
jgi:hypothetical protein